MSSWWNVRFTATARQHLFHCQYSLWRLDVGGMKAVARKFFSGAILSFLVLMTSMAFAAAPVKRPSPFFTGDKLPLPPKQMAAWSLASSNLPTTYITAAALLFEQGMADPRSCEYREIEVGTGDVWGGDGGVVKTHGWVFPGGGGRQFAVCWNGLVYPTVSVGTNADLV